MRIVTRMIGWAAVIAVVAGCNLNTLGQGKDTQAGLAEEDSGTGTGTASGTGPGVSSMPTEGAEGNATSGDVTGVDTTSDPPVDLGSGGVIEAMITISDGETFDFGGQDITTMGEHTFVVTNAGNGDATGLTIGELAGVFSQQSTTCGSMLAPMDTCEVVVGFTPDLFGVYDGQLEVSYDDGGQEASTMRPFTGRGVGITGNLIVNGGGEMGSPMDHPPVGWESLSGNDWGISDDRVRTGTYSILAGQHNGENEFVLRQSVDVASLTNWGDAAGVRFHMTAYHRVLDWNNDRSRVRLRFADSGDGELEQHTSDINFSPIWVEVTEERVAPGGTYSTQVLLICEYQEGTECSSYFDDIELRAEWTG